MCQFISRLAARGPDGDVLSGTCGFGSDLAICVALFQARNIVAMRGVYHIASTI